MTMELRALAEQVLFGTTLEEKLANPDEITDLDPGPALATPAAPGRPSELRFKSGSKDKSALPKVEPLATDRERGQLLHFFANHELLATELMALVLLRFPDAPPAFRRGVYQTLRDEQAHTRMYLSRMRACGVTFGELPVSGYFWRCVAPMQQPIDYVTGLCLTFEQANLDFTQAFARKFAHAGDTATAQLLQQIYRDEIAHVAHGLKWFRHWKPAGENDWTAYCRSLRFPLSPQRAKGTPFNFDGRRAAGLDPAFIAQLEVYAQSRGRTPGIYLFNPLAEGYVAAGSAFTPKRSQLQLAQDLENLPQFLCRRDDVVLVQEQPSVSFLRSLSQAGIPLPEFFLYRAGAPATVAPLHERKLGRLQPWACSPDSATILEPLIHSVSPELRPETPMFRPELADLFRKEWSARFLSDALTQLSRHPWLCPPEEIGAPATDLASALCLIERIRARGHHRVVVKESVGLAGSNALRLWEPELRPSQLRWMSKTLARGMTLVIEPWLDRRFDFSVQLEMAKEGLRLRGFTGLINDSRGQFQANWAEPHFAQRPPKRLASFFAPSMQVLPQLQAYYLALTEMLEPKLRAVRFSGPVGLDAFVYRADDGTNRLKPIVEINPRYTMGRLTLEMMRFVKPGASGLFRLLGPAAPASAHPSSRWPVLRALQRQFPVHLEGEPIPRIAEGLLCLNDPERARQALAVFVAHADTDTLLRTVQTPAGDSVA